MVTVYSKPVETRSTGHRFFYITGCDGTGKTTQAKLLLAHLEEQGIPAQHLWMRFPFFFTLPLLVYARLRGFSWYEEHNGIRQGYWDFHRSWLLRNLVPWILLLDAALAAVGKVYFALWRGKTIVCERFVLDMLVDLEIALRDPGLHRRLPGRLFLRLLPQDARIAILELDPDTLRSRRADLRIDRRLEDRVAAFRRLIMDQSLTSLSSHMSIDRLSREIQRMVKSEKS
jgi:hypothetical protein